ncbi:M14 family zinc carboxypeptidase [Epilithonimonas hungarica]|uniref:Zinc carboxypeptidase n=1 Tax=Epilithonimonas hungarica TaxID=454006 RepID=A0A1G7REV3_9FLAO|nr:M14 family zinc carboxypeptidase [Epilithonimonas hungarica]SDG09356.1 Zinc carboxypeptidase [Epilithonimonas hungarica]
MNFSFPYFKNVNFPKRYIFPEKLFSYLQSNYSDYIKEIGRSSFGKPIYMMSLGNGKTRVAAWSQMHGNESTATLAMLDLLSIWEKHPELKEKLFDSIQLDFIFMLNPDGSEVWTRRNAFDIDINRDYLRMSSVEMKILKSVVLEGNYDYALNLHDQRTIFTTDGKHPATLSFLAPSENVERTVTENRKKSMAVIAAIYLQMKQILPNRIAKYTDEFYPTSSGDNFMKAGVTPILFEGGFYENDLNREKTREFYTHALYFALKAISVLKGDTYSYETYFDIPQNRETHFDLIYRNVRLNTEFECILDIGVQYREILDDNRDLTYQPYVVEVGDLNHKKGWTEIDCTDKKFISVKRFPKLDALADFKIE